MPGGKTCSKCGSDRVFPARPMISGAMIVGLTIEREAPALMPTSARWSDLRAVVCGACGSTEFFATQPEALWRAYRRQPEPRPEHHAVEKACTSCGYDLRGHYGTGECPECGSPYRRPNKA